MRTLCLAYPIFILAPDREDAKVTENYVKNKFGTVFNIGVERFCQNLEDLDFSELSIEKVRFDSFQRIDMNSDKYVESTSEHTRNLLNFGKLNHDILKSNFTNNYYTIARSKESEIYEAIKNNEFICYIILSHMGNGKTVLMERLALLLSKEYQVFFLRTEKNNINVEVENISKLKGEKIIFVEDYTYFLESIGLFKLYLNSDLKDVKFVFSSRTFLNNSMTFHLNKYLDINMNQVVEYMVDNLGNTDSESLIELLDYSNYFDKYRNERKHNKMKVIKKRYKSEFRNVLIDLVKSQKFVTEVKGIYNKVSESSIAKDIILASSICNVIALKLENDDLLYSLDTPYLDSGLKNDEYLNIFVDLSSSRAYSKSSLFSKFVIENCSNYKDIKSVITKMVINADKCSDKKTTKRIRKVLISASNVSQIIKGFKKNYETDMTDFYNSIKHLYFYKNNPYFWIQYAMACMDIKQFVRAEDNLKIADDLFKKRNENYPNYDDSYQLQIQRERCRLESVLHYKQCENPFDLITTSYNIFKQLLDHRDTQKHLILKHMLLYQDVVKEFIDQFSIEELQEIYIKINEISNLLKNKKYLNTLSSGRQGPEFIYLDKFEKMEIEVLKQTAILAN